MRGEGNQSKINGDQWYQIMAMREVNQIIGRCIRHAKDYAAIFLVDERYKQKGISPNHHIDKLAKWLRDSLKV